MSPGLADIAFQHLHALFKRGCFVEIGDQTEFHIQQHAHLIRHSHLLFRGDVGVITIKAEAMIQHGLKTLSDKLFIYQR